jgi:hypothetical protein
MRRFLMLLLSVMLLLTALAVPVTATPIADLTALARYFPDKTLFFASVRTDDGFFSEIDSIVTIVRDHMPDVGIPSETVEQMLDRALSENPNLDGTFAEAVRPWLGNTAAVGFPSLNALVDDDPFNNLSDPVLIAAEVTDRAAAEAFFDQLMPDDAEVNIEQTSEYTLITPRDSDQHGAVYISGDVLLVTNDAALLPQDTVTATLRDAEDFNNSLSYLPESDYNAIFYINLPELLRKIPATALEPEQASLLSSLSSIVDAVGGQVWAATILDGRSLTLDAVQPITDPSVYEALGITVPTSATPISFDFARFIPAGTPLVIQGTDLQTVYNSAISSFTAAMRMQSEMMPGGAEDFEEQMQQGLAQLEFTIRAMTGLDLQDDILSWMTGNYAFALGFSPALEDLSPASRMPSSFPVDFSLLIEATDPDAAQAFVDGLRIGLFELTSSDFALTEETFGDVTAQVITLSPSDDMPFPLQIVFGASDEVFAIGTPRFAEAAFNPGDGLADDPSYVEMQSFALDTPSTLYYVAGEGLTPLVNALVATRSVNARDEDAINSLFRLLSSGSISSVVMENGTTLYRFALTLPE